MRKKTEVTERFNLIMPSSLMCGVRDVSMDKHIRVEIDALFEEYVPGGLEAGPTDVDLTIVRHHVCLLNGDTVKGGERYNIALPRPMGDELQASVRRLTERVGSDTAKGKKRQRYNLILPRGMFDELQAIAEKHKITVAETLRRCIQLELAPIVRVVEEYKRLRDSEFSELLSIE